MPCQFWSGVSGKQAQISGPGDLHVVDYHDTFLVNGIAGIQHKILCIVMFFPGDIERIGNSSDKGQLFGSHYIIFVDELHQPEKYNKFLPL